MSTRRLLFVLLIGGGLVVWDHAIIQWQGDGMESLSPPAHRAAQEVVSLLYGTCLDNPVQQMLTRHWYVVTVRKKLGCPPWSRHAPYAVIVQVSTFLGLPLVRVVYDPL